MEKEEDKISVWEAISKEYPPCQIHYYHDPIKDRMVLGEIIFSLKSSGHWLSLLRDKAKLVSALELKSKKKTKSKPKYT